jgi:hypothetical protein
MRASIRKWLAVIVACMGVLLLHAPASAHGVTIGLGASEENRTQHAYRPLLSGWWVGPTEVDTDPAAGFWTKELRLPRRVGLDSPLNLVEVLRVGSGFSWNGWHEEFLSAEWDWKQGAAYLFGPDALNISKISSGSFGPVSTIGAISAGGNSIDFAFANPLSEGSWLVLVKQFIWTGEAAGERPKSILVAQSPVPIPGALWLLGSGILGLVLIRRRSATANQ